MQNSRLAELETLLAKASTATPLSPMKGSTPSGPSVSSADTQKIKDEVRMLQEALDVMQKQAEEYEKEIKGLKDKSRSARGVRTGGGRVTPKKSSSMDLEATLSQLGQAGGSKSAASSSRDVLLESISLETALFRPALSSAVQSGAYWKGKAMGSALTKLAPLNVRITASMNIEPNVALNTVLKQGENNTKYQNELSLARNELRLAQASFSMVDLSKDNFRGQLNEQQQKEKMAEARLQSAATSWMKLANSGSVAQSSQNESGLLGRIVLPCRDGVNTTTPLSVNNAELRNLHSFLVQ